jgi:hypothetical protein
LWLCLGQYHDFLVNNTAYLPRSTSDFLVNNTAYLTGNRSTIVYYNTCHYDKSFTFTYLIIGFITYLLSYLHAYYLLTYLHALLLTYLLTYLLTPYIKNPDLQDTILSYLGFLDIFCNIPIVIRMFFFIIGPFEYITCICSIFVSSTFITNFHFVQHTKKFIQSI